MINDIINYLDEEDQEGIIVFVDQEKSLLQSRMGLDKSRIWGI